MTAPHPRSPTEVENNFARAWTAKANASPIITQIYDISRPQESMFCTSKLWSILPLVISRRPSLHQTPQVPWFYLSPFFLHPSLSRLLPCHVVTDTPTLWQTAPFLSITRFLSSHRASPITFQIIPSFLSGGSLKGFWSLFLEAFNLSRCFSQGKNTLCWVWITGSSCQSHPRGKMLTLSLCHRRIHTFVCQCCAFSCYFCGSIDNYMQSALLDPLECLGYTISIFWVWSRGSYRLWQVDRQKGSRMVFNTI